MEVLCIKEEKTPVIDKIELRGKVNFIEISKKFIKGNPLHFDNSGIWWGWNKELKCWKIIDETDLLNDIYAVFDDVSILNSTLKNQFFTALQMVARKNEPKEVPKTWIQFKDKIINYETSEEIKINSEYFLTNPLPWCIGENEDTPIIDKLFTSWVGEDKKRILYEIIAFSLLKAYPFQRIFILYGGGGNGKGQYLTIIENFLGQDNCTSSDLYWISKSRFEKAKLWKKLVCFVSETNAVILKYTSTLKKLCGGDLIGGEIKNKTPFTFKNYAKIIMASNSIPITTDKTHGFYRRMNISEFKNTFEDGKDIVDTIPNEEYENLGRKSLRILKELRGEGKFINDGSINERKERYERLSNPIISFIEENYEKVQQSQVTKADFVEKLKKWLNDHNFRMMNNKDITSALNMLGYEMKQKKENDFPIMKIYGLREKKTSFFDVPNGSNR